MPDPNNDNDEIHEILHRTDPEVIDRLYFQIVSGEGKDRFDLTSDESKIWDYFVTIIASLPDLGDSLRGDWDECCTNCGGSVHGDEAFKLFTDSVTDLMEQCPSGGQNCNETANSREWRTRHNYLLNEYLSAGGRDLTYISKNATPGEMKALGLAHAEYWKTHNE